MEAIFTVPRTTHRTAVRVYSSFIKRGTKGFWGEECLMEWCFAGGTRPPSISRGGASCLKMLQ